MPYYKYSILYPKQNPILNIKAPTLNPYNSPYRPHERDPMLIIKAPSLNAWLASSGAVVDSGCESSGRGGHTKVKHATIV